MDQTAVGFTELRRGQERVSDHFVTVGGGRYALGRVGGSPNWYVFRNGRRMESLRCSDFEQAKIALVVWAKVHAGLPSNGMPENVPIASVLDLYMREVSKRPKSNYLSTVRRAVYLINSEFGQSSVAALSNRPVQIQFIKQLADPSKANLKPATIARYMSVLCSALHMARDEIGVLQFFPKIITAQKKIGKYVSKSAERPNLRRLTIEEIASFLDSVRSRHFWRYCILALSTMARPEAICDIERSSILWDEGVVRLLPIGREQNNKRRPTIPMPPTLAGWLQGWDACDPKAVRHYVHRAGQRVGSISGAFRSTADRAGLVRATDYQNGVIIPERAVTPYTLRRSMANLLRAKIGLSLDDIAGMMGHSVDTREITDLYAYLTPEQMVRVVEGLEKIFDLISAHTVQAPMRWDDSVHESIFWIYGNDRPKLR